MASYTDADQAYYEAVTREVQEQQSVTFVHFFLYPAPRLSCTALSGAPRPPSHARPISRSV